MHTDRQRGIAWGGACLILLLLVSCGAPERSALSPPTPGLPAPLPASARPATATTATAVAIATPWETPTDTPEADSPTTPAATAVAIATPWETPTEPPTPVVSAVELPPAPALPLDQALAQFGNALLYSDRNGFLMLADGQRKLWLTADEAICDRASSYPQQYGKWSSDGRFIAITCYHAGMPVVALLDVPTGDLRVIQADARVEGWSPTALEFLISTRLDDKSRLSIVDARTGKVKLRSLFEHSSHALYPAWSPDGTQVAIYTGNGYHGTDGTSDLFLVKADGSDLRRLTHLFPPDQCGPLDWSPDGQFIFLRAEPRFYCYRISASTGAHDMVYYRDGVATLMRWSPDRRWYLLREQPQWSLYRADGTLVRQFSIDPALLVTDAGWMPDSRRIMLLAERPDVGIEVIATDIEGKQTTIATYSTDVPIPEELEIAPDGELLAINLDGSGVVILNPQGQVRARLGGYSHGWRPRR